MKTEAEIQAEIARRNLEYRSEHDRNDNPAVFSSWSYVCGINDGREIEREQWQAKVQGLVEFVTELSPAWLPENFRKRRHELLGKVAQFTSGQPAKGATIAKHNHITRDIKPIGQCPGCDAYHDKNMPKGIGKDGG